MKSMITETLHKENTIAITSSDSTCDQTAQQLAHELNIPLLPRTDSHVVDADYLLICTPQYLGLMNPKERKQKPFYIDFLSTKLQHRKKQATSRNELLIRALGSSARDNPLIIDATAGLGRDGWILASVGYHVIMIERSPILYALLRNALERAEKSATMADIVNRLQLIRADAKEWLTNLSPKEHPDIIYLDPMFPERKKRAAVKKEMVILQSILGKDEDASDLLNIALEVAKKRVIVKRPRLAANVSDLAASYKLEGTSSRFDIYLAKK